jgi:hypothetical protein
MGSPSTAAAEKAIAAENKRPAEDEDEPLIAAEEAELAQQVQQSADVLAQRAMESALSSELRKRDIPSIAYRASMDRCRSRPHTRLARKG